MSIVYDYVLGKIRKRDSISGMLPSELARLVTLENNEIKVAYFESVSGSTGTVTKPVGSTILLDQFPGAIDAYTSTLNSGEPTGKNPITAGSVIVDVTSFDALGNYILSGTPGSFPVAIIYILKIKAKDFSVLSINNIIESVSLTQSYQKIKYSGVIDGANNIFVFDHTPSAFYWGGQLQTEGSDYTLSGNTITMTTPPFIGDTVQGWGNY